MSLIGKIYTKRKHEHNPKNRCLNNSNQSKRSPTCIFRDLRWDESGWYKFILNVRVGSTHFKSKPIMGHARAALQANTKAELQDLMGYAQNGLAWPGPSQQLYTLSHVNKLQKKCLNP